MSNSVRVKPQQERATQRLAKFLDAAARVFAEIGDEAATMTAITEPRRSRRSAGGQLSRHAVVAPHTGDGKSNAELGSIVWIVLSP